MHAPMPMRLRSLGAVTDEAQKGYDARECDSSPKRRRLRKTREVEQEDRRCPRACDELIGCWPEEDKAHANFVSLFREHLDRALPDKDEYQKRHDVMLETAESDVMRQALKETLGRLAGESAREHAIASNASSKEHLKNKDCGKSRADSNAKNKRKQSEGPRHNYKQKTRPVLDELKHNTAGRPSAEPLSGEIHATAHTATELRQDTTPDTDRAPPLLQTPVHESFDCFRSQNVQLRTHHRDVLYGRLQQRIRDATILNRLCSTGPELQNGCEFFGPALSSSGNDFLERLQPLSGIPQPYGHMSDDASQGFYTPGSLSTARDHDAATPNDFCSIGQEHENGGEIFGGEGATSGQDISPELWDILTDLSTLEGVPTADDCTQETAV